MASLKWSNLSNSVGHSFSTWSAFQRFNGNTWSLPVLPIIRRQWERDEIDLDDVRVFTISMAGSGMNGMSSSLKYFFPLHSVPHLILTHGTRTRSSMDTSATWIFVLNWRFISFNLEICRLFVGGTWPTQKLSDLTVQFRQSWQEVLEKGSKNTWRPAGVDGSFVGCVRWAIRHLSIGQRWQSGQNDKISQWRWPTNQIDIFWRKRNNTNGIKSVVCASCHRRIH